MHGDRQHGPFPHPTRRRLRDVAGGGSAFQPEYFFITHSIQPLACIFPKCRLVSVLTFSAQCACLMASFMPWWACCALVYLAAVSPTRFAQLWPCATWVAAAALTCASPSACTREVSTAIAVSYRVAHRDRCGQRRRCGGPVCSLKGRRVGRIAANSAMQRGAFRVCCGVDIAGKFTAACVATPARSFRIVNIWLDSSCERGIVNTRDVEFPVLRRHIAV